jgi:spermidine synthase
MMQAHHTPADRNSMQPYQQIDSHTTPDGRLLTLYRQGDDLFINFDGRELMSTRTHRTECTLARVACRELSGSAKPRVLIGGLGLGYTAVAALECLPAQAKLVVAEFFEPVIRWNREHAERLGRPLDDPRTQLMHTDVWDALDGSTRYDGILLDVDNGPIGETLESNDRLYSGGGLARIQSSLVPGGLLAVWSAHPDKGFERRLRDVGFRDVVAEIARTGKGRGARHVIFLARSARTSRGGDGNRRQGKSARTGPLSRRPRR